MKIQSLFLVSIICFFCTNVFAEQATGLCKDGTAYTGASKRGACRGHKGIQEWYADKAPPAASPAEPAPVASKAAAPVASGVATGMCKDGTETTGGSKRGACRGHKGVKEWYADRSAATSAPASAPVAAPAVANGAATGMCKDDTETTGASKRGACRGHGGVKEWYANKSAAAPASAPAATAPVTTTPAVANGVATGMCKDGTETTGGSKRGACRGHKGVKEWYADKQAPIAPVVAPPAAAAPTTAPVQVAKPASAAPAAQVPTPAAGSGQVWVNTRSKIYHCEGSKFYGRTKQGEYMSEADAQAKGFVANRKKVCH
jgi:hypothetical protein